MLVGPGRPSALLVGAYAAACLLVPVAPVWSQPAAPSAAEGEPLRVAVACPGLDAEELRVVLAVEIRRVVLPGQGAAPVRVTCEADEASLVLAPPARPGERHIDLSGAPPVARPRLLALALAELLGYVRPKPPPSPEVPAPPPPPPPGSPLAVASPSPPARPAGALLAAVGAARLGGDALTGGGGVKGIWPVGGPRILSLELTYLAGRPRLAAGDVDLSEIGGAFALGVQRPRGGFAFGLSAGARADWVRLAGRPERSDLAGANLSALIFGPLLSANALSPRWGALRVALAVEAGYLARGVAGSAPDGSALAVRGAWAGATLGVGVEP
jgi:hypothetical protein